MPESSPLFVASDIHGHCDALVEALRGRGLVDGDATWTGGEARLWVLGDLFDRGRQGVEVLRLLRRLAGQAAADGGTVDTLLGNHEVLVLGSKRFGDETFTDVEGQDRQFLHWWVLNGGFEDELEELTEDEFDWLASRRVVHLVDQALLVHSDAESYLGYGRSEEAVNTAVRAVLASDEPEEWWQLFRELTRRHEFMGDDGPKRVRAMLRSFGGEEVIHGHSTIPDTTELEPEQVTQARRYCDGLVLNVDGGVYQGGRCLVVRLNLMEARLQPHAQRRGRAQADHHPSGERREGDQEADAPCRGRGSDRDGEGGDEGMPVGAPLQDSVVSHIRHNEARP